MVFKHFGYLVYQIQIGFSNRTGLRSYFLYLADTYFKKDIFFGFKIIIYGWLGYAYFLGYLIQANRSIAFFAK